jgi:hypothetical protein
MAISHIRTQIYFLSKIRLAETWKSKYFSQRVEKTIALQQAMKATRNKM